MVLRSAIAPAMATTPAAIFPMLLKDFQPGYGEDPGEEITALDKGVCLPGDGEKGLLQDVICVCELWDE